MADLVAQMIEWQRKIDAMPPVAHAIMAHHSVPYGAAFRQWDTKGRLLVWANRGQIADLPRRDYGGITIRSSVLVPPGVLGIPVVNA